MNVYYLLLRADRITERKKKASGLFIKTLQIWLVKAILGNYPLKSLYTFLCKNGRAELLKWFSNESSLKMVRRIMQLVSVEARDMVQSKRISPLGVSMKSSN